MSALSHVLADLKAYRQLPQPPDPVRVEAKLQIVVREFPSKSYALRAAICEAHSITVDEILSQKRDWFLVNARRELAGKLLSEGQSLSDIGRFMRKHHTTVMHWLGTDERQAIGRHAVAKMKRRLQSKRVESEEGK